MCNRPLAGLSCIHINMLLQGICKVTVPSRG